MIRYALVCGDCELDFEAWFAPSAAFDAQSEKRLVTCPDCGGARLNRSARNVFVAERNLSQLTLLPVDESLAFFSELSLPGWRGEIATKIVKEIRDRLRFLVDVGLDYLTLERKADSLSGGEAQRIRLASQIGAD